MKSNLIQVAISYAEKGFQVFPCRQKSKKPATPNGFKDATTDEQTIRGWWEQNPEYNVAVATGRASGFVVLDVDGEKGDTILLDRGLHTPATVTVKTPRGYHYWLSYPSGGIGSYTDIFGGNSGIDIRGDGGYVVVPGSVLDTGVYEWLMGLEEATLAECPDWLMERRSGLYKRPRVDVRATIEEGNRNQELFRFGCLLRRTFEGYEDILSALLTQNERRCNPPLPTNEVERIAVSVMRYEPEETNQVSSSPSPKKNDSDDTLPVMRRFTDMTPPTGPRPYIVEGVLFKGFAGAIYGDGGSAKSLLMMHLSQCVARGEDWLGFKTTQTNVLYLDFELDEDEQSRRAYQIASGMGYDSPPEGFFYISGAGYKSRDVFALALDVCKENNIGMVVVDSLGFALNGDAEASRDVLAFFREVEGSFRREGISLLNVDHQSKGGNYQDKTIFGSVYKSNAVRSVFQVEPGDRGDGYINLTLRHKKVNFGPLLEPFGASVEFEDESVRFNRRELDAGERAGEKTLNASERVLNALRDCGAMYPEDIARVTGLELGTVKNKLTTLRRSGEVTNTGNKNKDGAFEVSLSSTDTRDDDDDDTYLDSQRAA